MSQLIGHRKLAVLVVLGAAVLATAAAGGLLSVSSANGAAPETVSCLGPHDFCGAEVSIAGAAGEREVTVELPRTHPKFAAVTAIPESSSGSFSIHDATYRQDGSQYQFTLKTVRANPPDARIDLLFVDQIRPARLKQLRRATVVLTDFPRGWSVHINGDLAGHSNCTRNETNTTIATTGEQRQRESVGFDSYGGGVCLWQPSWVRYAVTITTATGEIIHVDNGFRYGQSFVAVQKYETSCEEPRDWYGPDTPSGREHVECDSANKYHEAAVQYVYLNYLGRSR